MEHMGSLRTALRDPSDSRSRSRSRQSKGERLREFEAKVDRLANQVRTLEASIETVATADQVEELEARVTSLNEAVSTVTSRTNFLERDRSFWRKFLIGLWKVFNGNAVESFAGSRDQYEAEANWEATAQAAAVDALVENNGVSAPAGDAAGSMAM